ncbi:MAG: DUF1697 domain-containing protein [Flavobacteriia bacterium]|nr:MAG: DUF1697 domain-containing protein [Flavobacteriia bacterium]
MNTYITLLRGINVSGQKMIKMTELRESLEQIGFHKVQTYIQSGNIIFETDIAGKEKIQDVVHAGILKDFGFEVPTLTLSRAEIEEILRSNPFAGEEGDKLYFVLLKNPPEKSLVDQFNGLQFENEDFHITNDCVYLLCKKGYGNAKLSNNLIERKLKVEATTRNLKTMQKLLEMTTKD